MEKRIEKYSIRPVTPEMLYLALAIFFCVIVITSNLITVKLFYAPFFTDLPLPAGLIIYPLTFLISDLVTEVFGTRKAKGMITIGFLMNIASIGIIKLAIALPPHPDWVSAYNPYGYTTAQSYQQAFASVFGLNSLAVLSSFLAYGVSQILDIQLFAFLKDLTKGSHLWLRNAGSTLTSQLVDTLVVTILLLWAGLRLDLSLVVHIALVCYLYKVIFTLTNIPLFYLAVKGTKWLLAEKG